MSYRALTFIEFEDWIEREPIGENVYRLEAINTWYSIINRYSAFV